MGSNMEHDRQDSGDDGERSAAARKHARGDDGARAGVGVARAFTFQFAARSSTKSDRGEGNGDAISKLCASKGMPHSFSLNGVVTPTHSSDGTDKKPSKSKTTEKKMMAKKSAVVARAEERIAGKARKTLAVMPTFRLAKSPHNMLRGEGANDSQARKSPAGFKMAFALPQTAPVPGNTPPPRNMALMTAKKSCMGEPRSSAAPLIAKGKHAVPQFKSSTFAKTTKTKTTGVAWGTTKPSTSEAGTSALTKKRASVSSQFETPTRAKKLKKACIASRDTPKAAVVNAGRIHVVSPNPISTSTITDNRNRTGAFRLNLPSHANDRRGQRTPTQEISSKVVHSRDTALQISGGRTTPQCSEHKEDFAQGLHPREPTKARIGRASPCKATPDKTDYQIRPSTSVSLTQIEEQLLDFHIDDQMIEQEEEEFANRLRVIQEFVDEVSSQQHGLRTRMLDAHAMASECLHDIVTDLIAEEGGVGILSLDKVSIQKDEFTMVGHC